VHSGATTEDLLQGLNFLSRSIEKKSASLKVLVESNFERFVRAKATIDNVYKEMVNPGQEPDPQLPRKVHSRQSSRQSAHFRKTSQSALFSQTGGTDWSDKRKNALIKEQEYGVLPIKIPLLEVQAKADEIWGPALGGREREDHLRTVMNSAEKPRTAFEIGSSISDCIKRRDHETLIEEYAKAKRLAEDARDVLETSIQTKTPLSDSDVFQLVLTARMWSDVEGQIESFKRDVWRKLAGTHFTKHSVNEENKPEEHMELISILLELGVEDNPIWVWLLSRYDFLKQKITGTFERSKVEIEIYRRRLSYGDKATLCQLAAHLGAANSDGRIRSDTSVDSAKEIELWEHIYTCLNGLLSTQRGVLGEVIEFWETAQSFIDGKAQRSLPAGVDGSSRKHHRLSTDGVKALTGGANDLVSLIRENVYSFFSDPPTEDLSMLLSPITPTPATPKTPKSATTPFFNDTRFKFDVNNIPPPSPSKGDSWEKYAFWPPNANSLSGVLYLGKIMLLVGTAACEMAGLSIASNAKSSVDPYKIMVNGIRERCVQAVCAAWSSDCENCKVLEDWTRAPDRPDITNLPSKLMNFEGFLLSNLQKILYISEATKRAGSPDIIVPPSTKLLQMVRSQFVGGLYKALNGMKDNAESPEVIEDDDSDGLTIPASNISLSTLKSSTVDPSCKVWSFALFPVVKLEY
jgi:exocyst complex component 2